MKPTLTMLCETCGDDRDFVRVNLERTLPVRGVEITAKVPLLQCPVCKSTNFDPDLDRDPMVPIYDAYRRRHHLLSPAEIRDIRTQYGMSPEAFANLLGMSPATLYRYEAGALQDEVHDALILLCRKPQNMKLIAARRRENLTALQHKRFQAATARVKAASTRAPSRRKARKRAAARS